MSISFHYLEIPKFKWKVTNVKNWLHSIAQNEGYHIDDINYIFCKDEYLLDINIQHLDHHTLTDIITFDLSESTNNHIEAEIYISYERVVENAQTFNVPIESELSRVVAHGLLHLCGYKDKTKEEEILMRSKENEYLSSSPLIKK